MIRMKRFRIKTSLLLKFSAVIFVVLTCLPITMNLPTLIRHILQIVSMVSFSLGLLMRKNKKMFLLFHLTTALVLIRVITIYKYTNTIPTCIFEVYTDFAFVFLGIYCYRYGEKDFCKRLVLLVVLCYAITSITTIVGLEKYPLAVREQGRVSSYSGLDGELFDLLKRQYRNHNIATWHQLYGMVFAIPCFIYAFFRSKRKRYLIVAIICEACVIRAQITFALLLSLIMVVCCVFFAVSRSRNLKIVGITLIFVGVMVLINIDSILLWMVKFSSNKNMMMLSSKIYDLLALFQGSSTGDVTARFNLYQKSINVFLEHPLLGQMLWGVNNSSIFSYHSEFLDTLGYYGLFGVAVVTTAIILYYRFIRRSKVSKQFVIILLVGFLSLYVFNLIWHTPQVFLGAFTMPALLACAFPQNNFFRREESLKI